MHYAFDAWMVRKFNWLPFARYADDGLVHARGYQEANYVLQEISKRFLEVGLEVHPNKTKIVMTQKSRKSILGVENHFDFLGFRFRFQGGYSLKRRSGFTTFSPVPSPKAMKRLRAETRDRWKLKSRLHVNLKEIADRVNPIIRGWFQYYRRFHKKDMQNLAKCIDEHLLKWGQRRYQTLRYRRLRSKDWLKSVYQRSPSLFVHWRFYMVT